MYEQTKQSNLIKYGLRRNKFRTINFFFYWQCSPFNNPTSNKLIYFCIALLH